MLQGDAAVERPVLFIHGAGETAYQEDEPLASSLRQALDSSYRVVYPHMPASFEATLADWTAPIALELAALAGPVTLVGHSVGATVLLKYLLDAQPARIASVHLLAAPFWGADDFWTWPEAALPADAAAKLANLPQLFLYHAEDDEVVPYAQLELYAQLLPAARPRRLAQGGHQFA